MGAVLQRKGARGGEQGFGDGRKPLLRKEHQGRSSRAGSEAAATLPMVHDVLQSSGRPLAPSDRAFFDPGFGHDFSAVRVHTDAAAASSAAAVDALAYTVGAHVVFADGQYTPHTQGGQRLLAHELAHVVQQHGAGDSAALAEHPQLEFEADLAAQRVTSGQPAGVRARGTAGMMRQPAGQGAARPSAPAPSPPSRVPTAAERRLIDAARGAAAVRTQVAHFRTAGIGPSPPDRRDDIAASEQRLRVTQLATRMFDWDPPNIDQIDEILGHMIGALAPGADIQVAGARDPACGARSGYVAGHRPPIVLCPGFFSESAEQQIRTLVHEAAHVAGIGNAALGESYCAIFDCEHGCGGFDSADSWAQYVHCLSGRPADQPTVIRGRAPTPPGRAPAGRPAQPAGGGARNSGASSAPQGNPPSVAAQTGVVRAPPQSAPASGSDQWSGSAGIGGTGHAYLSRPGPTDPASEAVVQLVAAYTRQIHAENRRGPELQVPVQLQISLTTGQVSLAGGAQLSYVIPFGHNRWQWGAFAQLLAGSPLNAAASLQIQPSVGTQIAFQPAKWVQLNLQGAAGITAQTNGPNSFDYGGTINIQFMH